MITEWLGSHNPIPLSVPSFEVSLKLFQQMLIIVDD
jgi:hypothetical protein